jgi:tetratricopeptide (TPR) repeat protein
MLTERFAFCQTMPMDEFLTTAEDLRKSGYRPIRFRPYAEGKGLRVAAIWTRDGRPWRLAQDQSIEEIRLTDEQNRKDGYLPVEVAGYVAAGGDEGKVTSRFAALWTQRTGRGDDARIVVASSAAELTRFQGQLKIDGLVPLTLHAWRQSKDEVSYSGVWHKVATGTAATASSQTGLSEGSIPSEVARQSGSLIDLSISAPPLLPITTKERATSYLQAAEAALKADPNDLRSWLTRASAHLDLGESEKAIDDLDLIINRTPKESSLMMQAYQFRAIALARLGRKDEARADREEYEKGNATGSYKLHLAVIVAAELGDGIDRAIEALEASLKQQPHDSDLHYDAACAYALASQALARKDQAKGRKFAERAIRLLGTAIENGYADYKYIQGDADLDPLRERPAFAEILHLDRSYTAVWAGDYRFEASPLLGLGPTTHLQRCRELASEGYRMVSLSLARTSPEGSPVASSAWRRPVINQEARDRLAERQARAAIALLRMGKAAEVLPLLRHSADPRLRSFIVNWLNPLGADPKTLAAELGARPRNGTGRSFIPLSLVSLDLQIGAHW